MFGTGAWKRQTDVKLAAVDERILNLESHFALHREYVIGQVTSLQCVQDKLRDDVHTMWDRLMPECVAMRADEV